MFELIHSSTSNEIYVQTADEKERYTILDQPPENEINPVIWLHYRILRENKSTLTRNLFVPKYGWQYPWETMRPNDSQQVDYQQSGAQSRLGVLRMFNGMLFLDPNRDNEQVIPVTSMAIDREAVKLVSQALQQAGMVTGPAPSLMLPVAADVHPLNETLLAPR